MKINLDVCLKKIRKEPDCNTRAMGTAVAIALIAILSSALLFGLLRGTALAFQAFMIYLPSLAFCFFMFWCPRRARFYAMIPTAVWFICFLTGMLIQTSLPSMIKLLLTVGAILMLASMLLTLTGIINVKNVFLVISVVLCIGCVIYGVYDLATAMAAGLVSWSEEVAAGSSSFVGGLLASGAQLEKAHIRINSFAFLIPAAMMFFCCAESAYLLAEPRTKDKED